MQARQVLPRGVSGGVVEPEEQVPAGRELLDVVQPAGPGGRFGLALDGAEAGRHPLPERPGLSRAVETEGRCALHPVVHHRGRDPARAVQQLHAPVVAGDQRPFGCRQRHVELSPRVLTLDQQRPRDPDRHLRGADEVLDVPGGQGRVEGVPADVLGMDAGDLADELPALRRGSPAVVVLQARDPAAQALGCRHGPAPASHRNGANRWFSAFDARAALGTAVRPDPPGRSPPGQLALAEHDAHGARGRICPGYPASIQVAGPARHQAGPGHSGAVSTAGDHGPLPLPRTALGISGGDG